MKTNPIQRSFRLITIISGLVLAIASGFAQGTAFRYQGQLNDGPAPANGIYDLQFNVYDQLTNGSLIAGPQTNAATALSNGLFTVTLDFGAGVFAGAPRWLEISVRTNGGGPFTTLTPRQNLLPVPYAIYSASAASATSAGSATQLTGTLSSNNIAAGSITTTMLANGAVGSNQLAAGAVNSTALASGSVTSVKLASAYYAPFVLTVTNPTPGLDSFGISVAAVGSDRFIVGSYADDVGATDAGVAYLFSTNGTLLQMFTNPTPATSEAFGGTVEAMGLDRVLIGAHGVNGGSGEVYLYRTNGVLLTTFTNPTPAANDFFGIWSIAPVGRDHVIIGSYADDTGGTDVGAAYLFTTNGALLTTFTNPAPLASSLFGASVAAVGGDRVVIGAHGYNANSGRAYLFNTNGSFLMTFTNPAAASGDLFGLSVATVGTDRVLIGARGKANVGAAYLFSTNGTLLTTFANPTPGSGDEFGYLVAALDNDRVIIGAAGDDDPVSNSGVVHIFNTGGTLLLTVTNPTPAVNDTFGNRLVAVGNNRVLVGAPSDDAGATDSGVVHLFNIESYASGLVADNVRIGAVSAGSISGVFSASQIPDLDALKITSGVLNSNRIPGLSATNLVAGTLSDARLSTNVALLNANQTFSGINSFTNSNNSFTGTFNGSGTGLSNLNASQVSSGTLALARLPGAVVTNNQSGVTFAGIITATNLSTPASQSLVLQAGQGTGNGGSLSIAAGHAGVPSGGAGGNLSLQAGNAMASGGAGYGGLGPAGTVSILGGNGYNSAGGDITLQSGPNSPWSLAGNGYSKISLKGGELNSGDGGAITVEGGHNTLSDGSAVSAGGQVTIVSGNGVGGYNGGNILLLPGTGAVPGRVGIGKSNPATLLDVNGTVTASAFSGSGASLTGLNASQVTSGTIPFASLPSALVTNNQSGVAFAGVITATNLSTPASQTLVLQAGQGTGNGGSLNVAAGNAGVPSGGAGGNLSLRAGHAMASGGSGWGGLGPAGTVSILGGNGYNSVGGDVTLQSGPNSPWSLTGNGYSKVSLKGGELNAGDGASITVEGGHNPLSNGTSVSAGGHVTITTGNGVGGYDGGNILLLPGSGANAGRVGIGTANPTNTLHVAGGVSATAFVTTSDRNAKENFAPVNPREILDKVSTLPILQWNFKQTQGGKHIGPMAQDFYAAFHCGASDTTITTVDPDGVALAAIQGLNQRLTDELKQKQSEITELQRRLEKLESLVSEKSGGAK